MTLIGFSLIAPLDCICKLVVDDFQESERRLLLAYKNILYSSEHNAVLRYAAMVRKTCIECMEYSSIAESISDFTVRRAAEVELQRKTTDADAADSAAENKKKDLSSPTSAKKKTAADADNDAEGPDTVAYWRIQANMLMNQMVKLIPDPGSETAMAATLKAAIFTNLCHLWRIPSGAI